MKESSKERLATLLMDELLERLSSRDSLRKILGEMTSLPIDEVVEQLLNDFERVAEEYREKHIAKAKQSPERKPKQTKEEPPAPIPESLPKNNVDVVPTLESPKEDAVAPSASEQQVSTPVQVEQPVPELPKPEPPAVPEPKRQEPPPQKIDEPQKKAPSSPSVKLDPIKLEFPKIRLKVPDLPSVAKSSPPPAKEIHPVEEKKETPGVGKHRTAADEEELRRLEQLASTIEAEYAARKKQQPSPRVEEHPKVDTVEHVVPVVEDFSASADDDEEILSAEVTGSPKQTTRARYNFTDDDYVYVHAVGKIPEGETAVPDPFMLEEKGIDGHEFAFAFDYGGVRFYLSKVNPNEVSVSKAMVLLLNKQESLQLQGVHESILNDLRGHGVLLPFEFGTVARGKDYLTGLLDKNLEDLQEALDDMGETTWWSVTASVLDSTIARIVGTDVQSIGRERTRDRASYISSPHGKKFDVKVLERILQREKKLAESIHEELSTVSQRSDIDTMVGLGSGSSEDWKVILKGSYDVPKRDVNKFTRAVTDLQYHHLQYDLMLSLTGNKEFFTLRRK